MGNLSTNRTFDKQKGSSTKNQVSHYVAIVVKYEKKIKIKKERPIEQ